MISDEQEIPLHQLLPHGAEAVLLSGIDMYDKVSLTAFTDWQTLATQHQDAAAHSISLALECMAQATAVWQHLQHRSALAATTDGYLVQVRQFQAHVPAMGSYGRTLTSVSLDGQNAQLARFNGSVTRGAQVLATAQFCVYSSSTG